MKISDVAYNLIVILAFALGFNTFAATLVWLAIALLIVSGIILIWGVGYLNRSEVSKTYVYDPFTLRSIISHVLTFVTVVATFNAGYKITAISYIVLVILVLHVLAPMVRDSVRKQTL